MKERDTDSDWEAVAKDDPYWGVLSVDEYKGREISPELKNEFFSSGRAFIENVLAFARKHVVEDFSPTRSLDFGCGVGRLLIPLAEKSQSAVGVDVSDTMLGICRENCSSVGLSNVTLIKSDDTLSKVEGRFNFINSYIVLQHIPVERGMRILRRMMDLLDVGGVCSIQLTYAKSRRFFIHETSKALYYRRDGNNIIDISAVDAAAPAGTITMFDYDLNQIFAIIHSISGEPILILPTNDDDHLGVHLIFSKARG